LHDLSYDIQDVPDLMMSIDLEQFEKFFYDTLNGDIDEDAFKDYYQSLIVQSFY
jgi:hypothetical protein